MTYLNYDRLGELDAEAFQTARRQCQGKIA
jgi:hypothetical protein